MLTDPMARALAVMKGGRALAHYGCARVFHEETGENGHALRDALLEQRYLYEFAPNFYQIAPAGRKALEEATKNGTRQ